MSAPPMIWGGGRRSPSASHIPAHTTAVDTRPEEAERVILLGDFDDLRVHWYVPEGGRTRFGRSVPCEAVNGRTCPYCESEVRTRFNYYAPALVHPHGDTDPAGRPVWWPVCFYMPEKSFPSLGGVGPMRGREYRVWRKPWGANSRIRTQFNGRVNDLSVDAFDVRPMLTAQWFPTPAHKAAAAAITATVPPFVVFPPRARYQPEEAPVGKAAWSPELVEQFERAKRGLPVTPADPLPAEPEATPAAPAKPAHRSKSKPPAPKPEESPAEFKDRRADFRKRLKNKQPVTAEEVAEFGEGHASFLVQGSEAAAKLGATKSTKPIASTVLDSDFGAMPEGGAR